MARSLANCWRSLRSAAASRAASAANITVGQQRDACRAEAHALGTLAPQPSALPWSTRLRRPGQALAAAWCAHDRHQISSSGACASSSSARASHVGPCGSGTTLVAHEDRGHRMLVTDGRTGCFSNAAIRRARSRSAGLHQQHGQIVARATWLDADPAARLVSMMRR